MDNYNGNNYQEKAAIAGDLFRRYQIAEGHADPGKIDVFWRPGFEFNYAKNVGVNGSTHNVVRQIPSSIAVEANRMVSGQGPYDTGLVERLRSVELGK